MTATRATLEAIREAVTSVPGVAALDAGRFGEVAVLFPGARIHGFRTTNDPISLEIHLVYDIDSRRPVRQVCDDVRTAATAAAAGEFTSFDIVVVDAQKVSEL